LIDDDDDDDDDDDADDADDADDDADDADDADDDADDADDADDDADDADDDDDAHVNTVIWLPSRSSRPTSWNDINQVSTFLFCRVFHAHDLQQVLLLTLDFLFALQCHALHPGRDAEVGHHSGRNVLEARSCLHAPCDIQTPGQTNRSEMTFASDAEAVKNNERMAIGRKMGSVAVLHTTVVCGHDEQPVLAIDPGRV
jgi:hypothetical protein